MGMLGDPTEDVSTLLPSGLQVEGLLEMLHIPVIFSVLNTAADSPSSICKRKPPHWNPLEQQPLFRKKA